MTKRSPIPPGMDYQCPSCHNLFKDCDCLPTSRRTASIKKQYYTTQRCICGQPYISNIPELPTRPQKENLEPDWSVPPALDKHGESRYYRKTNNALNWFFFFVLAFAMGAFCAMVALSKWP